MSKCLICNKDLAKGIASAKKENGDYYLICPSCGNVHYVKVLDNGLTELRRTSNEDTVETEMEMMEAASLFVKAGADLMEYKVGIHSEKENIENLNIGKMSKEENEHLKKCYDMLPSDLKEDMSYKEFAEDYLKFKVDMDKNPEKTVNDIANHIINILDSLIDDEDEDCDCEDCDCTECASHPSNEDDYYDDEEDEESVTQILESALPKFILEGHTKEGEVIFATAKNEDELAEALEEAENESIIIDKVNRVDLNLVPVKIEKKYKIVE